MDINEIKKMSLDDRKKMIDYIVGMPTDIQNFLLLHLNDAFMDPMIIKGNNRNISIYSSLIKYLDNKRNNVKILDEGAIMSDYQSEFCYICEKIYDANITNRTTPIGKLKRPYIKALMGPSCDIDAFIDTERTISMYLNDKTNISESSKLAWIKTFNEEIMIYKAKVYDLYGEYIMSMRSQSDIFKNNNMEHILLCINEVINQKNPGYADQHDLAVFIYKYLEILGIGNRFDELGIFTRFKYAMIANNQDDEFINNVYDNVHELLDTPMETRYMSLNLVYPDKYSHIFSYSYDENGASIPNCANKSNGIIFFNIPTNITFDIDRISIELKKMNKKAISDYIPNSKESDISLFLSDNDFGNINMTNNITLCTAYDIFDNSMYHIGLYDNDIYLLFKSSNVHGCILGLSIVKTSNLRNVLTIKRNSKCTYKYIPNI